MPAASRRRRRAAPPGASAHHRDNHHHDNNRGSERPSFAETFAEAQQARWEQATDPVRDTAQRHAQRTEHPDGTDEGLHPTAGSSPAVTGGVWTLRRGVLGLGGLGFLALAGAEAVSGHGAAWAAAEALLVIVTVWTRAGVQAGRRP